MEKEWIKVVEEIRDLDEEYSIADLIGKTFHAEVDTRQHGYFVTDQGVRRWVRWNEVESAECWKCGERVVDGCSECLDCMMEGLQKEVGIA